MDVEELNKISGHVVDAAMRVHSKLGPGLLESAYEACLAYELRKRGLRVVTQHPMPLTYDEVQIELGYRLDLLVEDSLIVELKSVAKVLAVHEAQLLSYLILGDHRLGLLVNFHVAHLKDGIRRMANGL